MSHDLVEEIKVSGQELMERVRELLQEGTIRRIVIKNSKNETLLEVPLTWGVIGMGGAFMLAPILSSVAAFAFFAKDTRLWVERYPEAEDKTMKNEMTGEKFGGDPSKNNRARDPYEIEVDFEVLD